jgi:hypothetical protein
MGFFDSYRRRRAANTGPESIGTLEYMEDFFQNGANWTQHAYQRADGTRCLVGAANHVRSSSVDYAKFWLRQAIAERAPGIRTIEQFNDTRRSYAEIAAVIARAKQLAAAAQRPALPAPVMEILPPERPALPARDLAPVVPDPRQVRVRRRRSLADWVD